MRTFADVFPHVMLFSNAEADFFLLGSKQPWQTDLARARAVHEDNEYLLRFFSRLRRGLDDPFTLLARTFVLGDEDFRRFAAAGELHTDDKLQLEFSGPRNLLTRRSSEILDGLTAEKRTLLPDGIAPLLGRDARWAQLYAMAAIGHLRALEPEKAADMIKRALDIDRANPQAWTGLGLVNEASAKDKEAIGAYKKAIAYRPGYAWAHARLGALLIATEDDKEGVRHLKRALVLEPGDPFANFRLAEFYAKRGETRSAKPLLDAALSLPIPDDDLWEAVSNLQKSLD
jgi:tetratricopeptide (TPR) repeat protein